MENLNSFIQILLWIVLPVLALAVIITVIVHYWRKRQETKNLLKEDFLEDTPVAFKQPPTINTTLDLPVEKKDANMNYTDEIEKNREVIAHLKSEFSFLEKKYDELKAAAKHSKNNGDAAGENTAVLNEMLRHSESKVLSLSNELQQFKNTNGEYAHSMELLKKEIASLKNAPHNQLNTSDAKTAELETRLKESEMQLFVLQEAMNNKLKGKDHELMQVQLEKEKYYTQITELKQKETKQQNHTNEEYENLLKENDRLKSKVTDYSYFDDLVNEKKQQITFLENQIEQRVRQLHDMEQSFYAELKKVELYGAQLASLKADYEDTSHKLAEQIKLHDYQLLELDRLRRESQQQGTVVNEKQHVINDLVNNLKLEKESTALLQQTISTDKSTILQLTQQIDDQFKKIEDLEGKLKISSQLLARIYTDLGKSFASIFSDDMNTLPENSKLRELSKELNLSGMQEGEIVYRS
jgi:chromosome segregation ATPase